MIVVNCSRAAYCKNENNTRACRICQFNANCTVTPKFNNFDPKIGGMRFLP